MNYILFDNSLSREHLKPFTFVRPIAQIRLGILTIAQKWEHYLNTSISYLTEDYLQAKYPLKIEDKNILINGTVIPNHALIPFITNLKKGEALYSGDICVAFYQDNTTPIHFPLENVPPPTQRTHVSIKVLQNLTDIFGMNGEEIQVDFQLITKGRTSQPIEDKHTIVYHPENIFIEEGVQLKACVLNAEDGVIYLGKNSQVSEGSLIQGNFALCEGSTISLGAKIRNNTTIGPYCKVGGEISNCVFFGYSNKAHDGFLGNSVIAEWCNLGADTNGSNLKNNYGNVKIWSYAHHEFRDTGKQFCGLMMGDHTKVGINTMFNTGTVVGVNCNIFGQGFPLKFVPSFSWGGGSHFEDYDLLKAFEVAEKVMQRRGKQLDETERNILREVKKRKSLFYKQSVEN
jgi:UDP-N-acetylglucosamine diphosphorylase/glucosamine-1-phosphate N-acetyltransferase